MRHLSLVGMPSTLRFVRDGEGVVEALELTDVGWERFERVDGEQTENAEGS